MGLLDMFQGQREEFDGKHHASVTHELLGGAVAFEAAKAYEDHCARNGKPDNHALAKELFAGFAGAAVDRLVETKGLDAWDAHQRKKALDHAQQQVNENFTQQQFNETVVVNDYNNDY